MSDWVAHKQPQSMGYYKKQEVEYQFALANAFTICDAYHCAMHAGTNPNRKFIWTEPMDLQVQVLRVWSMNLMGLDHQQKVMNGRRILSVYSRLA